MNETSMGARAVDLFQSFERTEESLFINSNLPRPGHSCSPGRCVRFPTGLCADVSKSGVLSLESPSFSILHLKAKGLAKEFGSGSMYEIVAPHAWSPLNFPHTHKEAKASCASERNRQMATRLGQSSQRQGDRADRNR